MIKHTLSKNIDLLLNERKSAMQRKKLLLSKINFKLVVYRAFYLCSLGIEPTNNNNNNNNNNK